MASKKELKRSVKQMVYDVMDECDYVITNGGKKWDEAEALMDEVVGFYEAIVKKISAAKTKDDFKPLIEEIEKAQDEFTDKVNAINE